MRMAELIAQKKAGDPLSGDQIRWWINGYVAGAIPDYQVAALLMAICLRGMSTEETLALTMAMAYSGDVVDLRDIPGVKVDKHSTGGVGDTTTLIAAPLAAACGVKVAKMSGRGLGHTGGTIDKLESIPGFNATLSPAQFRAIVTEVGIAITGQTGNLVPADRLLYALRDVTGTVDSLPLIASSIMSKKIASGADAIVLDVKAGSGAFLSSVKDAQALAEAMVAIGEGAGRRTVALITDMDQPLGSAIGNSLEIWEALEVLRGRTAGPLCELSLQVAAEMVVAAGIAIGDGARLLVERALASGEALASFARLVAAQGGDARVVGDDTLLPQPTERRPLASPVAGFVTSMNTQAIGRAALYLGAGRARADDAIDYAAGLVLSKRIGDPVAVGETLATLHLGPRSDVTAASRLLLEAIHVGPKPVAPGKLVLGRVLA